MSFSIRQQELDKLCWGYKVLRLRLTKYWRGRVPGVPGGVDAYDCRVAVPGNIHSGVSGNDSIMATGVFSAHELLRITRRTYFITPARLFVTYLLTYLPAR